MMEFLASTDFWGILFKVLITALLSTAIGAMCTLIGKLIARFKNSRLTRHAKIAVRAAEQKFPNEGKKMGPEKMEYVMDYLAITFPKIKSNQYLYNIAEAAVFELNREKEKKEAEQAFKDKYGELPGEYEDIQEKAPEVAEDISAKAEEETKNESTSNTESKDLSAFNLKSF